MRNLFALVGAGTIAFVGLGWYLDWYKLSRLPAGAANGSQSLKVDLNASKFTDDLKKGIERGGEIIDHLREGNVKNEENLEPKPEAPKSTGPASQFLTPSSSLNPTTSNSIWRPLDGQPTNTEPGQVIRVSSPVR